MRATIRLAAAVVLTALSFNAFSADKDKGGYRFVGVSSAKVSPVSGFKGMTEACQAEFGAEARMATTVEVADANEFPSITTSWVRAVIVNAVADPGTSSTARWFDATGITYPAPPNCNGWSGAGGSGAVVRPNYAITPIFCDASTTVACSIPN